MKNLLIVTLAALAFNVNAATITIDETSNPRLDSVFVDVGVSHWDRSTGLEWLDFGSLVNDSMTFSHSLNSAEASYGVSNGGWRLAKASEVYGLFDMFFPTYDGGTTGVMTVPEGDGTSDLIMSRNSWLFGFGTDAHVTNGTITSDFDGLSSMGLYADENGNVQVAGVRVITSNPLTSYLYGDEFDLTSLTRDSAFTDVGVFMVRDYTVVPIPAAVWLFGSGLLGLVAVARRRV